MTYQDFLAKLLALGAKLPLLWPIILQMIDMFQQALIILSGEHALMGTHSERSFSVPETDSESQVAALFNEHASKSFGAIGDGSIIDALRQAWAFIETHPALSQLIATFLASLLKAKA